MQPVSKVKEVLSFICVFTTFIYVVVMGLIHPNWSRSGIAFFDDWYWWYPALVIMLIGLHLSGAFPPRKK